MLGYMVRRLRVSQSITRRELAQIVGISTEEIRLLEHNLPVRLDVRRRILKELWSRKTRYPNAPVQDSKTG